MIEERENIYKKFVGLKPLNCNRTDEYSVETICSGLPHKLGITTTGFPVIFVECSDGKVTSDIRLKLFKVSFNRMCKLKEGDKTIDKNFSIIQLNSDREDFQKYFLEVMYLVLIKLAAKPKIEQLKKEVTKIVSLFTAPATISKDVIKGLWAELFLIERSKNPLYMINSWHMSPEDKYDFNDGCDKIEVKATSNEDRVHHFAIEQLHPNKDSQLLIASLILINSGLGKDVFDLVDSISSKVSDMDALLKLNEVIMSTIGNHIEEVKGVKFDYVLAKDYVKFFNYIDIPKIKLSDVPLGVSAVHFASCLSGLHDVNPNRMSGNLYKSI